MIYRIYQEMLAKAKANVNPMVGHEFHIDKVQSQLFWLVHYNDQDILKTEWEQVEYKRWKKKFFGITFFIRFE